MVLLAMRAALVAWIETSLMRAGQPLLGSITPAAAVACRSQHSNAPTQAIL
jgi:hypothetical protein